MRIVVAPNAFKGSMSSVDAARAIASGIQAISPELDVVLTPVADGGDGLTEVMIQALGGKLKRRKVHGPLKTEVEASYCLVPEKDVAVIEMAKASGLALLPPELRDPTLTTTRGTGELIRAALDDGARRIIIGLGGSATCDGGIGMAAALGFRFLDGDGNWLEPIGASLASICSIDRSAVDSRLQSTTFEAVCDVSNPLLGPNGASFVYSPQKGATPAQVEQLDQGLRNLAEIVLQETGKRIDDLAGGGAAGGLAAGLHAFLGAKLEKGIDLVLDIVGLKEQLDGADLVITGEGQIDYQTQYDKAPAGVARLAKQMNVPCIGICGSIGERVEELLPLGFNAIFSICQGPQTLESAMAAGPHQLSCQAEQVMRTFLAGRNRNRFPPENAPCSSA